MQISLDGINIELIRKNVKNINLRISRDKKVKVTYPYLMSTSKVEKFLKSKEDWIIKSLNNQKDEHSEYNNKESKDKLLELALPVLEKWQKITGLEVDQLKARYMVSRWGVYNKKNNSITLSTQLLAYRDCLDYIVLHELAHVKYSNHGYDFKNYLTQYLPEWKVMRAKLH